MDEILVIFQPESLEKIFFALFSRLDHLTFIFMIVYLRLIISLSSC